jgi:3-ketosteroid 9alpha-monooxygenase subunit A
MPSSQARTPRTWSHPMAMRPTGWFQIGWSAEFPAGSVKPLKYFGQDLVAFRSESGVLAVLDAHCPHLGAHLGYGGKVKGECVACPYHGWEWNTAGENARIPYQDKPINKRQRTWHVLEQDEGVLMWHDPAGGPPRWSPPNVFDFLAERPAKPADYYPAFPHASKIWSDEPICPQQGMENAPDTMHFRYTHHAPEDPVMLSFHSAENAWTKMVGFRSARTKEIAMSLRSHNAGVGLTYSEYHGRNAYRLLLAHTPVDESVSDIRLSYWFPRAPGAAEEMPQKLRDIAIATFAFTDQDLMIWRHQAYIDKPVFAAQDVEAYSSFRRFCLQFYDDDAGPQQAARQRSVKAV